MNKPLQTELWENIRTFAIDDPTSGFPFSKKLQKENNWSTAFTQLAIEEYRKFIFLCCILPNGASPSAVVDQVWHLHLTFTANYWIDFCKNTLHQDIHHYPSKGGNLEQVKHHNWYRQTLEQYQEIFGTVPPVTIWPAAVMEYKPIEFDIYEKGFLQKTIWLFVTLTVIFIVLINPYKLSGPDFLTFYLLLLIAGLGVSLILQEHKLKKINLHMEESFPKKFTTFQIARFLYGPHKAYQAALIDLLKKDIIDTTGEVYTLSNSTQFNTVSDPNPLLPAITAFIQPGNKFSYQKGYELMDYAKLQQPELDELVRLSKKVDYPKFIIPGIVLAIGFARMLQGMANEKPVTYLVFEIGFFSLIGLMIAAQYSYTYLIFKQGQKLWMQQNNNGYGPDILNNFTILGTAAIAGFAEYGVLTNVFLAEAPQKRAYNDGGVGADYSSCSGGSDSSGGSGSSGCSSGGGCGSGCGGGCGGCGS